MALIKFGGGVVQMSGSIAGTTYARNRYGNYARARTKPVNPNTGLQQVIRAAMAFLTARWAQTLTNAQRIAWNLYGTNVAMTNRLGEVVNLSGFNHYIRSNMIRKQAGWAIIDDGPVVFELPAQDPTFAITPSEATQDISLAFDDTMDWDDENGGYMVFFQGIPMNPQRSFFAGPWRFFHAIQGVNGAPVVSPQVGSVAYAIAELQRQWCYARIIRADGRISLPFRDDAFVGA